MEWYILWYGMVSVVVVLLLAAAGTNTILWRVPSYMTARAIVYLLNIQYSYSISISISISITYLE